MYTGPNLYPSLLCLCCFLCVFARVDVIASLHVFALLVNEMWSSVDATCGMSGFALNNHELHGASQPGNQTRKLKDVAHQVPTASNVQQQCNCFAALLGLEERTNKNRVARRTLVPLPNTTTLLVDVREANKLLQESMCGSSCSESQTDF